MRYTGGRFLLGRGLRLHKPWLALLALCCLALQAAPVYAAGSSRAIAQGFNISGNASDFVTGALVSTTQADPKAVELASAKTINRLIGVVDKDPLLTLSGGDKEVQVVLGGTTSVLVSDINGPINPGDKIAPSPIAGVGMLATTDNQIVGTAQTKFQLPDSETRSVTDSKGKPHDVHIGYITLQVGVAYYQAPGSNFLPPFVQRIANGVAGKPVSLIRITTSSLLLLVSFVGVTVLVYTATRSAIVSLGRNPLASHDILRGLYQALGVAAAAAVVTLLASYLVLTV